MGGERVEHRKEKEKSTQSANLCALELELAPVVKGAEGAVTEGGPVTVGASETGDAGDSRPGKTSAAWRHLG